MSAPVVTTREGWALEVRAFVDPDARLYISTREINRQGFTGCVVNGVAYYVSAHLSRDPVTGAWSFHNHSALHMTRAEWRGKVQDWTWPARRKLEARLIEFATEYAKKNPDAFALASSEYRDEQITKRQTRIAELRAEIETLSAELQALEG